MIRFRVHGSRQGKEVQRLPQPTHRKEMKMKAKVMLCFMAVAGFLMFCAAWGITGFSGAALADPPPHHHDDGETLYEAIFIGPDVLAVVSDMVLSDLKGSDREKLEGTGRLCFPFEPSLKINGVNDLGDALILAQQNNLDLVDLGLEVTEDGDVKLREGIEGNCRISAGYTEGANVLLRYTWEVADDFFAINVGGAGTDTQGVVVDGTLSTSATVAWCDTEFQINWQPPRRRGRGPGVVNLWSFGELDSAASFVAETGPQPQ